jgi:hypothetical protein
MTTRPIALGWLPAGWFNHHTGGWMDVRPAERQPDGKEWHRSVSQI